MHISSKSKSEYEADNLTNYSSNSKIKDITLTSLSILTKEINIILKKNDIKRDNYSSSFNLWINNQKDTIFKELSENKKVLSINNYVKDINNSYVNDAIFSKNKEEINLLSKRINLRLKNECDINRKQLRKIDLNSRSNSSKRINNLNEKK